MLFHNATMERRSDGPNILLGTVEMKIAVAFTSKHHHESYLLLVSALVILCSLANVFVNGTAMLQGD